MDTLRRRSSGRDVVALQKRLIALGFPTGATDGSFGASTEAAVIAFQLSEGLVADGVVGPGTARALELDSPPPFPSVIGAVTVSIVSKMFPATPKRNIEKYLPSILDSLAAQQLADKDMVLMALGTVRAEAESFVPVSEGESRFNTPPGGPPFALYDNRKDLGNQGPPDGSRYKGRGFVQLTGRANYASHGKRIGLGQTLVDNPDRANDPHVAADLLASFLKRQEIGIRQAFADHDLPTALALARRLVNGGSHGLDRFSSAYMIGDDLLPDDVAVTRGLRKPVVRARRRARRPRSKRPKRPAPSAKRPRRRR